MKTLKLSAPPLIPLILTAVYCPINENYTANILGCGCHPGFNANSFNGILALVVLGVSVGLLVWASLALAGWRRIAYLVCGIAFQCVTSWFFWSFSLWR